MTMSRRLAVVVLLTMVTALADVLRPLVDRYVVYDLQS